MITLKDYMTVVNYRITEASDYGWNCYGENAYSLDSWNGDHSGHNISIIFDRHNQTVYEVAAYDYKNERAYRLINPEFIKNHHTEATSRDIMANIAWDNVAYTDLESTEDFLIKAEAIVNDHEYDTRVSVPVELDDATLIKLSLQAHNQDVTLNDYVNRVLREQMDFASTNQGQS